MRLRLPPFAVGLVLAATLSGCADRLVVASETPQACPAALLGPVRVLLAADGVSTVALPEGGVAVRLRWPDGYGFLPDRSGGGHVVDEDAQPVVRIGERVWIGGGSGADDTEWVPCGGVSREDPTQ